MYLPLHALVAAAIQAASVLGPASRPLPLKTSWTVESVRCPVGCSTHMREFLAKMKGTSVELGPVAVRGAFLDGCDHAAFVLSPTPVSRIVAELNEIAPRPVFRRSMLPVSGETTTSGTAVCRDNGSSVIVRILSIEADRAVLLFEERSLVILR